MNFNVITKNVQAIPNKEETLVIQGIASTSNPDLDHEVVTPEALESMCKQINNLGLHLDHNHSYDGLIGVIRTAELKSNELWITAEIFSEHATGIREKLDMGAQLGLSIGGLPVRDELNPDLIRDFNLLEISLTPMPCNQDTRGSVSVVKSCINGACYDYLKEIKKLSKEEIITTEETVKAVKPEEEYDEPVAEVKSLEEKEVCEEPEEEIIEEKAVEEPSYITRDEIGAILDEFMAEKEEQIKADIIAQLESEAEAKACNDEEEVKAEPVDDDLVDQEIAEEIAEEEAEQIMEEEEEKPLSKYASYKEEATNKTVSFLDSETRDYLGRNKSYL